MGKDKNKNIDFATRQIKRDKDLLKNWKKYGISDVKQGRLEAKIAAKEAKKAELEAS